MTPYLNYFINHQLLPSKLRFSIFFLDCKIMQKSYIDVEPFNSKLHFYALVYLYDEEKIISE